MDELITRIKDDIRKEKIRHEPLNERSWQYEYGVLLTVTEAEQIVEMYERKQKEAKPQSNCNKPAVSISLPSYDIVREAANNYAFNRYYEQGNPYDTTVTDFEEGVKWIGRYIKR